MMNVGGYNASVTGYYGNEIANASRSKTKDDGKVQEKPKTAQATKTSESNESKLSEKAQNFLKNLREANDDMDFFVANSGDDMEGLFAGSTKEFSVAFSNEELEKMADDEEYANQKLDSVRNAMDMSDRISKQLGLEDKDVSISKIGISMNDDGTMSIFAELEKSSAKQRERIEQAREKRAGEQKEAKEKAAEEKEEVKEKDAGRIGERYGRSDVARTTVEASSEEELLEKIAQIDWNKVSENAPQNIGAQLDLTV
ncbi:MAG: hypothetical protein IJ682_04010 [Lachnospiraceae bacterium]|nr:hypothetical protein [Lachnospiraceae bacterium]